MIREVTAFRVCGSGVCGMLSMMARGLAVSASVLDQAAHWDGSYVAVWRNGLSQRETDVDQR